MSDATPPIPLVLVTGASGAGKLRFLRALVATQPATERWALLCNDGSPGLLAATPRLQRVTVGGCACCTGALMLRTALVRLLRDASSQRVILVAAAAAEPAALRRMLQDEHLVQALAPARHVHVATAAQWVALPESARDTLRRQMQDAEIIAGGNRLGTAALRAALHGAGLAGQRIVETAAALDILRTPAAG